MFDSVLKLSRTARRQSTARKLARVVQPTDVERHFQEDDIIVSKTDLKGNMTYVNRTFMAIAGYDEHELLGQPHSLIRHPDMPRCVFKLLWDRLGDGHEIFAYVKNMTRAGDYYWVLAHATPSVTNSGQIVGYHSSRRVPNRRIVNDVIIPLYASLKEIEDREPDRRAGLEKSFAHLVGLLREKGASYDELIATL